mgnify:FL=1
MPDTKQTSQKENTIEPVAIMDNLHAVFPAMALVAGVQLGVFTALETGPGKAGWIAENIGVQAAKLTPLLYALVVADVLQVEDDVFSNTPEATKFLVK